MPQLDRVHISWTVDHPLKRDNKLRITEVKIIREDHTEEYFEYDTNTISWRYDIV